jgi:hypothetical protein
MSRGLYHFIERWPLASPEATSVSVEANGTLALRSIFKGKEKT